MQDQYSAERAESQPASEKSDEHAERKDIDLATDEDIEAVLADLAPDIEAALAKLDIEVETALTALEPDIERAFAELGPEVEKALTALDAKSPSGKSKPNSVKVAQDRLDKAIETERRLEREIRAAKEATKAARRDRDEAIKARDRKTEAPSPTLKTQIRAAIEKYSRRSDPEIKKANAAARLKRHRDKIKADPIRAEEQKQKDAERKRRQYHARKGSA